MPKLTKRTVDALKTPAKKTIVWDTKLKGFGIVLRPSAVHSFVFNYRNRSGDDRRITIGQVGTLTPEQARKKAEAHRDTVRDGRDPQDEKRKAKEAPTVGELLDGYLAGERFRRKAPSTQAVDRSRIENHLRPLLGKARLEALTPFDVEAAHRKIATGKTAKADRSGKKKHGRVRGGEGTARMAIRLLRAILSWGRIMKILPAGFTPDVAAGVEIGRDGRRNAILDDPAAYLRLWQTLDRLTDPDRIGEGETPVAQAAADAIRVIALTGARKGEITGLRWKFVNLKTGTLTLPTDAHKTGRKTGAERVIGLPALAAAIIARQPEGDADAPVFRPARDGKALDLSTPWRRVRKAAGLPATIGLHGLRHSLASHMAMEGAQAAEIMAALGHRDITTSQKYIHWDRDRRQQLAEKAAATITAAIAGVSGNVVELPKRA